MCMILSIIMNEMPFSFSFFFTFCRGFKFNIENMCLKFLSTAIYFTVSHIQTQISLSRNLSSFYKIRLELEETSGHKDHSFFPAYSFSCILYITVCLSHLFEGLLPSFKVAFVLFLFFKQYRNPLLLALFIYIFIYLGAYSVD